MLADRTKPQAHGLAMLMGASLGLTDQALLRNRGSETRIIRNNALRQVRDLPPISMAKPFPREVANDERRGAGL